MNFSKVIVSQYLAALEMLKQAIVKCPDSIWNDHSDNTKFWHVASHALFYTHLYLHPTFRTLRTEKIAILDLRTK